jgi:hypothetical protein
MEREDRPHTKQERSQNKIRFYEALITSTSILRTPSRFDPELVEASEAWVKREHIPIGFILSLDDKQFDKTQKKWRVNMDVERLKVFRHGMMSHPSFRKDDPDGNGKAS